MLSAGSGAGAGVGAVICGWDRFVSSDYTKAKHLAHSPKAIFFFSRGDLRKSGVEFYSLGTEPPIIAERSPPAALMREPTIVLPHVIG